MISLGDLAQSTLLRRHSAILKADMQKLSIEVVTGQATDTAVQVAGDLVPITAIDSALARLQSYGAVTTEAGLFAGAMQTALDTVDNLAAGLTAALFTAVSGANTGRLVAVSAEARQAFGTAVTVLNTRIGDRALFSGIKTDTSPLCDAETILAALETAVGGAASVSDVTAAIDGWFDAPEGFAAVAYQGGSQLEPYSVAAGEEAELTITANDTTLRQTLKGLAMAALLDRGMLATQPEARVKLASSAADILLQNQIDRTDLSARLGTTEAKIANAAARNTAETTSLQMARNALTSVDPFETATKLQNVQSQLEMIYTLTARMSRLSLVNFL